MRLRGKGKKKKDGDEAPRPQGAGPQGAGPGDAAPEEAAAPAGDDASDEPAEPTTDGDDEGESADALRDKWLRAVAEADNARKRARADLDEARRFGNSALLLELLPVLDNLQRALATPPEGLDPQFLQGLQLIAQQWTTALAAHGVQPLEAEPGTPFDPTVHRALLEQETEEHAPGVIVSEILRGYRLHDRLLREAQVVVAKAPAPDAPGEAGEPVEPDSPDETEGDDGPAGDDGETDDAPARDAD